MFGITLGNGKEGKAGRTFESQDNAQAMCDRMNAKAAELRIKVRYSVVPVTKDWLDKNESVRP